MWKSQHPVDDPAAGWPGILDEGAKIAGVELKKHLSADQSRQRGVQSMLIEIDPCRSLHVDDPGPHTQKRCSESDAGGQLEGNPSGKPAGRILAPCRVEETHRDPPRKIR